MSLEHEMLPKVHMQKFLSVSIAKTVLQANQEKAHYKKKSKQTMSLWKIVQELEMCLLCLPTKSLKASH